MIKLLPILKKTAPDQEGLKAVFLINSLKNMNELNILERSYFWGVLRPQPPLTSEKLRFFAKIQCYKFNLIENMRYKLLFNWTFSKLVLSRFYKKPNNNR